MKKRLILTVFSATLMGCESTQTITPPLAVAPPLECTYFGKPDVTAPSWICSAKANHDEYIRAAVGFSGNTAGGLAHQKNLAVLQAKKELADQVKSEIITSVKSKTGTLGVEGMSGASAATSAEMQSISNVELTGVEILRSIRGADGYFYVHVGLPRKVLQQNIENLVEKVQTASPASKTNPKSTLLENQKLADEIAKALSGV